MAPKPGIQWALRNMGRWGLPPQAPRSWGSFLADASSPEPSTATPLGGSWGPWVAPEGKLWALYQDGLTQPYREVTAPSGLQEGTPVLASSALRTSTRPGSLLPPPVPGPGAKLDLCLGFLKAGSQISFRWPPCGARLPSPWLAPPGSPWAHSERGWELSHQHLGSDHMEFSVCDGSDVSTWPGQARCLGLCPDHGHSAGYWPPEAPGMPWLSEGLGWPPCAQAPAAHPPLLAAPLVFQPWAIPSFSRALQPHHKVYPGECPALSCAHTVQVP